jgi:hypothetical protein
MKKKTLPVVLLLVLLAVLIVPSPVLADGDISVTDRGVVVDFPTQVVFRVSAESDAEINDIRLHYRINRAEHAQITSEIYIGFTPASSVTVEWYLDMRKTGGMPPGSSLDYWWTVTDAAGNSISTAPVEVVIADNRYQWQSLTEGEVTLYWYEGDDDFSGELMAAAQEVLTRLDEEAGAALESPVSIYIYANQADLLGSMIFPQEWTGGVAFTAYGIIAIGIEPVRSYIDWGKRAIAHELTHLVVHQVTFSPYGGLPTWLDEGLAMNSEGELDPAFAKLLVDAIDENGLISVRSLASPFSTKYELSLLAYAQSCEVVRYLIDEYGREDMFALLSTFRQGSGYDEALEKVYGFDMDGLDERWRASAGIVPPDTTPPPVVTVVTGMPSLLAGLIAGLAVAILLLLSLTAEEWQWRRSH